jgi:hypothetical protein
MPQKHSKERTIGETINTWMQIAGILLAGAWGVYTFFEKEVFIPKSAPVNISINLQLKKVGTGSASQASLAAVEMNVMRTPCAIHALGRINGLVQSFADW